MNGLSIEAARVLADTSVTTTVLQVLGGLIAALVAAAGIIGTWAALRVGRNSQIISTYRASAESWENRANSLSAEKQGVEEQLSGALQAVQSLQAKNDALQGLVTGQPAVEKLSRDMNRKFSELTEHIRRIENALKGKADVRPDAD
jgi:hypothetical protein